MASPRLHYEYHIPNLVYQIGAFPSLPDGRHHRARSIFYQGSL